DLVGDIAWLINFADFNNIFGGGVRLDGVRVAARTIVGAFAGVARAEHKEHGLGAGDLGQRVADGSIVAGGGEVVGLVIRVMPTVVGDEGLGSGGGLLEVGIGGGAGIGIGHHGKISCRGGLAAELQADGGHD